MQPNAKYVSLVRMLENVNELYHSLWLKPMLKLGSIPHILKSNLDVSCLKISFNE